MRTKYGVDPSLRTVYDTLKRAELEGLSLRKSFEKMNSEACFRVWFQKYEMDAITH